MTAQLYAVQAYRYSPVSRCYSWVTVRYTYDPSNSVVLSPLGRVQPSRVQAA